MNLKEARQFVAHFVKGDYTPEEYAIFLQWLRGATLEELNEIADEHEALHEQWDVAGLTPAAEWRKQLEGKLDRAAKGEEMLIGVTGENRSILRRLSRGKTVSMVARKAWIAAASVVVLLGAGAIWYTQQGSSKIAHNRPELPAMTKTVVNPSGGAQKEVVLADGSRVLLNLASILKYPETFSGSERVVELSGEAYFEVSPKGGRPFRVLIKDAEVNVLGTNFNVRAYADEPVSRTTLIDGSVEMEIGSNKAILKPGQQAVIAYPSTGDIDVRKVDVDEVMAWKKGYFRFTNESMYVVMRVLSRYYNVEIQCDQNASSAKVSGSVSREKGLSENFSQFQPLGFRFNAVGNAGSSQIVKVTR
ncbi:FecR family protein [Puia sp.]|jgi:ferric-dicitrate binding protein FerR (iron transport regulator)|uniref:FecR family protein n=1 Tax=Puia sp. TaxID=2045100 RepID=UPI002F41F659